MQDNGNKKTLILSILGVLLLVIAVVGVSFAMYTFSATGSRENVIQTGSVSISYDATDKEDGSGATADGVIALTNQYPMTDALGIAQSGDGSVLKFNVNADINGTITIKYDLGFDAITEGTTLKDEMVKFVLYKEGTTDPIVGTAAAGVTVASRATVAGPNGYITTYGLTGDTFTATATHSYTLKAWVSSDYDLPGGNVTSENGVHSSTTTSETFKFKVKVVAKQA